jgi:peptide/nickel transport system substrate-binding protein
MPDRALSISQAVAHDLAEVGLKVRLEAEADRPEYARQIGRKAMGDLALFDSSPHSTYRVLNDKISSVSRGIWWQGHEDPQLETMIAGANAAVTPPDRRRAYGRCLARLNANPAWLYLLHPVQVFAARPSARKLSLDAMGVLRLQA